MHVCTCLFFSHLAPTLSGECLHMSRLQRVGCQRPKPGGPASSGYSGSASHASQRTATEHSRHALCEPLSSDSEADYAPCRPASNHRAATEASRRTATEHSPATSRKLDPDIRLQKYRTTGTARIKAHHPRTPDVGIGILISMPSYRAGEDSKTLSYRAYLERPNSSLSTTISIHARILILIVIE